MVSAITVAAIPVPENVAYNPESDKAAVYADVVSTENESINITEAAKAKKLVRSDILSDAQAVNKGKTYAVSSIGGISYLDWQFEYAADSAYNNGFITNLNLQYRNDDTLEIGEYLFLDYAYIEGEALNQVFESNPLVTVPKTVDITLHAGSVTKSIPTYTFGYRYTLSGDPYREVPPTEEGAASTWVLNEAWQQSDEYKFFDENFKNDLNGYVASYEQFHNKKIPTPPASIVRSLFDKDELSSKEKQDIYLCKKLFGDRLGYSMTIERMNMYTYSGDTQGTAQVYLIKVNDNNVATSQKLDFGANGVYYTDYNKYLTTQFIRVVGFAENAFQGKKSSRVTNLVLGSNILHICDRAFEDTNLISSVSIPRGAQLGNQVFKNCSNLGAVSIGEITEITKEAFYGTPLERVDIPKTVAVIDDGAFANCGALNTVQFSNDTSTVETKINNGSFADCERLANANFGQQHITRIGDYAFALSSSVGKDRLLDFIFPDYITNGDAEVSKNRGIGEFVLANRQALKNVYIPSGLSTVSVLPDTMVSGCINLDSVKFPESCGGVTFDSTMFSDVTNLNFYVEGPSRYGADYAGPRKSTWAAKMDINNTNSPVPYKFTENGVQSFEIYQAPENPGDKGFILGIDENGTLVNCAFEPGYQPSDSSPVEKVPLIVPASVAGRPVAAIASDCFKRDDGTATHGVLSHIKSLTIVDGCGISAIADGAFANSTIEELDLGNSITSIGAGAFENCDELTKVTLGKGINELKSKAFKGCNDLEDIYFETPNSLAEFPLENIGPEALSTGGKKLTVHGEIDKSYGPFAWAMQDGNYVDSAKGIRVLYETPLIATEDHEEGEKSSIKIILDNTNLLPTLVDIPHYSLLSSELRSKVESGQPLTNSEQEIINRITHIQVPAGIQSVDVKGFIDGKASDSITNKDNSQSVATYLTGLPYYDQYEKNGLFNGYYGSYSDGSSSAVTDSYGKDYQADYPADSSDYQNFEKNPIGNDRITRVTLTDVTYLPDKCFESCEKLSIVNLGSAMSDVGKLPFFGCTNLTSVACGSGNYTCENGILYKNLSGDNKAIVECLPSRGGVVGESTINVNNDPTLAQVATIEDGAFSDCDGIKYVYFTGVNNLKEIPKNCFSDCDNIKKIDIPVNIATIGNEAFSNIKSDVEVTARNRNVVLATDAFKGTTEISSPSYITYEEAPSRIYADQAGVNVEEILEDMFEVVYYYYDSNDQKHIIYTTNAKKGSDASRPDDADLDRSAEGLVFDRWRGSYKNIQGPTEIEAIYKPAPTYPEGTPGVNPEGTPGVNPVGTPGVTPQGTPGVNPGGTPGVTPQGTPGVKPTDSVKKVKLTVIYGSGTGSYAKGTTVIIEAIDAPSGKEFDKWVINQGSGTIYSATSKATTIELGSGDVTITATYKNIGAASSGGGSGSSSTTGTTNRDDRPVSNGTGSNTIVNITKPGISNVDKAYASVSGSTDSFIVKVTESADAANQVASALAGRFADMSPIKYFAMDISLYDSTGINKIENVSGISVNVTIPIPDALAQYGGNNRVGAVANGVLEDLPAKFVSIDGIPCVSFTATHFSPYTIYVDTNNITAGTMDYSPKTGDPIHPKWFVSIALAAASLFMFLKRDKRVYVKA